MTSGPAKAPWNLDGNQDYALSFDIAEGRDRADITARAARVFASANDARKKYTSGPDLTKRQAAIEQALAWRGILRYLDKTGRDTFTLAEYRKWAHSPAYRADRILGVLWLPRWRLSLRFHFGTKPVTFYDLPDAQT